MIHGPPEVVALAVDLHKHLVKVPATVARPHPLDAPFPDLGDEHRSEAQPPGPHGLVAYVDAALAERSSS